jgi:hypothetical protein
LLLSAAALRAPNRHRWHYAAAIETYMFCMWLFTVSTPFSYTIHSSRYFALLRDGSSAWRTASAARTAAGKLLKQKKTSASVANGL